MISVLSRVTVGRHEGLHDVWGASWGDGDMFWAVPNGCACRNSTLPVTNLTEIHEISISLERGICWVLVDTEDPHQQSTKLKTTQYSIGDGHNNHDFAKTCISDDSGPYQSYTKIENFGSLMLGFDLVVSQDPRQQSRNFKFQDSVHGTFQNIKNFQNRFKELGERVNWKSAPK